MELFIRKSVLVHLLFFYCSLLYADYKDDISYTKLASELGLNIPDGNGILVTQVEAATAFVDHDNNPTTADRPVYLPDPDNPSFSGKTIVDQTGFQSGIYSSHATGVGKFFYGIDSMASSADLIHAYWADNWLQSGFLKYGSGKPLSSSSRIANHSWVGNITDLAVAADMLRRMDWLIETDEFIQIIGVRNATGTNYNLFSAAYNTLAVGKTDGIHSTGSPFVDATYPSGRIRTEIVAPFTTTSSSTAAVSAAAVLLVDTGNSNPGLSTDLSESSVQNRNGDTVYNAERQEIIKAALLAGADRLTVNTSTTANITDYRAISANQTNNGLDARFGAGQVNVYNSYQVIAAGEQNSNEDGGIGSSGINSSGFDYDPSFGGANGSNNVASYYFSTGNIPEILTASLTWNVAIDGGNGPNFSGEAIFYDLDLYLYDVTQSASLVISSTSQIDNSENIWISLAPNRNYLLQVVPKSGQSSFNWDYAIAWSMIYDTDDDGFNDSIDYDDDNDGLSDVEEQSIGTNPLVVDTDNDGYSDYDEVQAGSDPLNINSIPVISNGDINNDSAVNIQDLILGRKILLGKVELTDDFLARGDVAPLVDNEPSPNGIFDLGDYIIIQRKVFGEIDF